MLADWLREFTPKAITEAVNDVEGGIEKRKGGRTPDHPANLAALFDLIEQRLKSGEKLESIFALLEENYKKFTTNCRPTSGALRGMYYRAKNDTRRRAVAGHYCRFGDVVLPMLLVEKPCGVLELAELDLLAVQQVAPRVEFSGPRPPGWDLSVVDSDAPSGTVIKRPSSPRRR